MNVFLPSKQENYTHGVCDEDKRPLAIERIDSGNGIEPSYQAGIGENKSSASCRMKLVNSDLHFWDKGSSICVQLSNDEIHLLCRQEAHTASSCSHDIANSVYTRNSKVWVVTSIVHVHHEWPKPSAWKSFRVTKTFSYQICIPLFLTSNAVDYRSGAWKRTTNIRFILSGKTIPQ